MTTASASLILSDHLHLASTHLAREVTVDLFYPASGMPGPCSLLLINDGQDLEKMHFASLLDTMYRRSALRPLICVGIHAGLERRMEYGTQRVPDYKSRGVRAPAYNAFIFSELLPFLEQRFPSGFRDRAFAGFSLGALSALDIVWQNPGIFSRVGCFSGSFWWRSLDQEDDGYDDNLHRIMHQEIRQGIMVPGLQFFFQCGALDETKDRNQNGIIDSIDDTLDLIAELEARGYRRDTDIHYLELPDGHHDVFTWGRAMPEFLEWGWGS